MKLYKVAVLEKNMPVNAGEIRDTGSIPGWGRTSGGGHGIQTSLRPFNTHAHTHTHTHMHVKPVFVLSLFGYVQLFVTP